MSTQSRRSNLQLLAALAAAAALPQLAFAGEEPAAVAAETTVAAANTAPQFGDPEFVNYLLDEIDDVNRGESSHGLLQMKVKTRHYTRDMAMESWSLGEKYSLIRILEPKKERGTATLKSGEDLFTYLSKTGRTVKITGAMMGSHFTNDDLVKGSRLRDEFTATVSEGATPGGIATYNLVLIPKPDTAVVWGKIDVTMRKSDLKPLTQIFYDEDGAPARRMEFADYANIGGRVTPTRITMTPLDRENEFTEVRYARMQFNVGLTPDFFTLQRLKSM